MKDDKGLYIDDLDRLMRRVTEGLPMLDSEELYLSELSIQGKIFMACMVSGILMLILGLML